MASYGTGFSAGLNSGMSMGKMLMDTYNDAKQKDDLEKAGAIDQQIIENDLTDEQKGHIQAIRDQKLDDGTAAYEVQDVGKGVRIRAAGNPDGEWGTVTGLKQYKLGNKTQDTEFSKEDIARARGDAIADVYTKNGDPMRGLQYKQASREVRQADNEEKILDFMRNSSNMDDDTFYSGLSKMATGHGNDGLSFGYTKGPNGENLIGMVGTDGKLVLQPATRDMAVSKLLQYVSPKNYQQERVYGLEREKLQETRDYHQGTIDIHKEANQINRERNGLLAGRESGGSASVKTLQPKVEALTGVLMKANPEMDEKTATMLAWKSFVPGLGKQTAEAQVKYKDDETGTEISGPASAVERERMKNPVYRAGAGSDYKMNQPAGNQTGTAPSAPVKPMSIDYSDAAYDNYLAYAKRGDRQAKAILAGWVNSNELSAGQRKEAEKYTR